MREQIERTARELLGWTRGHFVFETIDQLEKTEIESRERVLYDERFGDALLPALALLLLEGIFVTTRLRRVP